MSQHKNMLAIMLTDDNLETILPTTDISREALVKMIDEYDNFTLGSARMYFVPQYMTDEPGGASWGTIPQVFMDSHFEYDKSKIENQFVLIKAVPETAN